jgi:hypothetical protein
MSEYTYPKAVCSRLPQVQDFLRGHETHMTLEYRSKAEAQDVQVECFSRSAMKIGCYYDHQRGSEYVFARDKGSYASYSGSACKA